MKTTSFCLDERGAFVVRAAFTPFARVTGIQDPKTCEDGYDAMWSLNGESIMIELSAGLFESSCTLRAAD